ncbi:CoA transferase subunit A [Lederbergia citrea]|uniref:CoA transferase subunit A n=1 Tax=Lederbergia citrea TaxID=2833581 RepID=UPI001BC90D5A|nr:CoA transferase subunit A [Lederbergia citrea]MBS4176649.1 CoA transferase subunit A [Lederbergia citrea]
MESPFSKVSTIEETLEHFHCGMTLMFGGFGGVGTPPTLIKAILDSGIDRLFLIGNDTGFPEIGIGKIVSAGRAQKLITSHIGSNPFAGKLMEEGKLDVEFSPQGILAERIRAGGVGLKAIVTEIGADNPIIRKGKLQTMIDGSTYLIETALTADVSIIYAEKADTAGNLLYDKSARNTNPLVAMAGNFTIVEAKEIVPVGSLSPEEIITPGIFVDMVVQSKGVDWKWAWETQ